MFYQLCVVNNMHFDSKTTVSDLHVHGQALSTRGVRTTSYIKDNEVEEDKQNMHHNAHDELQLADHPSSILQGVRQILALLVYLQQADFDE